MSDDVRIVVRADDLTGPGFNSVNRGLRGLQRDADGRLRDLRGRFVSESALIRGALNGVAGALSGGGSGGGMALLPAMKAVGVVAGTALLPALGGLAPILFGVGAAGGAAALAMGAIKEEAKKLKPEFEGLKKAAEKAVMPGVSKGFKDLKVALKDLQPVVKVGGEAFGEFVAKAGAFAKSPAFQGALLKNVQMGSQFFDKFTTSILTFTQSFLDFGTKSKPTFDALTNGLSGLLSQGLPGLFQGLERGISGSAQMLNGLFSAINEKLLPAFGRLAGEVAQQLGPSFGELFKLMGSAGALGMDALAGTLRLLQPVFKDITFGLKAISQVGAIIGPTMRDTGRAILDAFAPAGKKVDGMRGPLERLSGWITENKGSIQEGARMIGNAIIGMVEVGITTLPYLIQAFRYLSTATLTSLDVIVSGAATAFGWIPGIGDKLKAANRDFDRFKGGFLRGLEEAEQKTRNFAESVAPRLRENRLKMNIANWQSQIATAKAQMKTVPPEKRAKLLANIKDLENKIAAAKKHLNSIDGKVATTYVQTIYTTKAGVRAGGHAKGSGGREFATGGIVGAAGGGPRSRMTLVGEQGPELVDLAPGSRVRSNPDTRRMMGGWPAGEGGGEPIHITLELDGERLAELMVDPQRRVVARRGGVQATFGRL